MTEYSGYLPYEPQMLPVEWAKDIWTVNGPEVTYRFAGLAIPCPTRMTVVRLDTGALLLHSPIAFSESLNVALSTLGPIGAIVAPNTYHHLHVDTWASAYPSAQVFAVSNVVEKIVTDSHTIQDHLSLFEDRGLPCTVIELGKFQEAVFFHRPSETLIVADLMQNFEAKRVRSKFSRALLTVGGATGPDGRPSIEVRHLAHKHKEAMQRTVQRMIEWNPSQIILSHGACYRLGAVEHLERAFAWANLR